MEHCDQGCSCIREAKFGTVSKPVWRGWLTKDYIGKIVRPNIPVFLKLAEHQNCVGCLSSVQIWQPLESLQSWMFRLIFVLFYFQIGTKQSL